MRLERMLAGEWEGIGGDSSWQEGAQRVAVLDGIGVEWMAAKSGDK